MYCKHLIMSACHGLNTGRADIQAHNIHFAARPGLLQSRRYWLAALQKMVDQGFRMSHALACTQEGLTSSPGNCNDNEDAQARSVGDQCVGGWPTLGRPQGILSMEHIVWAAAQLCLCVRNRGISYLPGAAGQPDGRSYALAAELQAEHGCAQIPD